MASGTSDSSPLPTQRLLGKVALVTGGASGIGESTVRLFHKHGAKACIVDIEDDLGQHLCETLGVGNTVCYLHCDVTQEDDVRHAVDFTVEKFGTLDIMVNNAGLSGPTCSDIREVEMSVFEKVFDVNVKGVFLGMKHAARIMIPPKKGSIVSICSVTSVDGGMGPHAYAGSKFLHSFELTVDDVANAVLFLSSDDARYVSGANLMVDGGVTCVNHSPGVFR